MGADGADLAQKLYILFTGSLFAGQDEIVGLGPEHFKGSTIVVRARNVPGGQDFPNSRND
jgi:hypothetical protein